MPDHIGKLAAVALCATISSTSSFANEAINTGPTLSVGGAYTDFDSERSLDNALAPEIGVGYRFSQQLSAELLYSQFKVDRKQASGDARLKNYRLDGFYDFEGLGNELIPYVVVGIGEFREQLKAADDRDDTRIHAGAGLRKHLTSNLSLRGDVRAVRSLDYNQLEGMANIALTWTFGQARNAVATSVPAPAPAPVVQPAEPVVLDSDNDGVADASDLCPDSARGAVVSATGCVGQEVIDLLVEFDFDSDSVRSSAINRIEKMGLYLQRNTSVKITIEGHTDSKGAASYNKQLSQKRADAVRTILIEQYGIEPERVEAMGFGEEKPAASNEAAEGRQQNRRVLAVIR